VRATRVVFGLLVYGLFAGCAMMPGLESQEPAPSTQVGASRPALEVEKLLAYFEKVRGLPGADLGREHEVVRQAFLTSRSEFDRVRLALLLSLPGTPFGNEPHALELLEPIARNPDGHLHGLAVLLATNLQERKRLDANAQGLQQKIDALRSLERTMIERKR